MHSNLKIAIPLILSILFLGASGLIIIIGYLIPATQNQGYTARICTCGQSYINNQRLSQQPSTNQPTRDSPLMYTGTVDLTYVLSSGTINDNVEVLTSRSYEIIKNYLLINFKLNSRVVCYVSESTNSIKVHLLSSTIALGFSAAFTILSVIFFSIFVGCCCWYTRKRSEYIDLDIVRK